MFDFITVSPNVNHLSFGESCLKQIPLPRTSETTKFDFNILFVYNPGVDEGGLTCRLTCSRDLLKETTAARISRRLQHVVEATLLFEPQRNSH